MYNITLSDSLLNQVRPSFASEKDLQEWMQLQLETVMIKFCADMKQAVFSKARTAIDAMRRQSEETGNSTMTLNDINEEIRMARAERKVAFAK